MEKKPEGNRPHPEDTIAVHIDDMNRCENLSFQEQLPLFNTLRKELKIIKRKLGDNFKDKRGINIKAIVNELSKEGKEAYQKLIEANWGLVMGSAAAFKRHGDTYADSISAGYIGLIHAVLGYNANFETRFSTYAIPPINQSMIRTFRAEGKMEKIPDHICVIIKKIWETLDGNEDLDVREVSKQVFMENKCPVSPSVRGRILEIVQGRNGFCSLDAPLKVSKNGKPFSRNNLAHEDDYLRDKEALEIAEMADNIREKLHPSRSSLTKSEYLTLLFRSGVEIRQEDFALMTQEQIQKCNRIENNRERKEEELTFSEIGKIYGVSKQRMQAIHAKAIEKARKYCKKECELLGQNIL